MRPKAYRWVSLLPKFIEKGWRQRCEQTAQRVLLEGGARCTGTLRGEASPDPGRTKSEKAPEQGTPGLSCEEDVGTGDGFLKGLS